MIHFYVSDWVVSMFYLVHISFCFPHSLRLWLGWLERPFRFWHGYAAYEKDARSFLSTSEGWPCGHWELVSGATGVDEMSFVICRMGAPCTTQHSHMFIHQQFSLPVVMTKMMTCNRSIHCNYLKFYSVVIKIVRQFFLTQRNRFSVPRGRFGPENCSA